VHAESPSGVDIERQSPVIDRVIRPPVWLLALRGLVCAWLIYFAVAVWRDPAAVVAFLVPMLALLWATRRDRVEIRGDAVRFVRFFVIDEFARTDIRGIVGRAYGRREAYVMLQAGVATKRRYLRSVWPFLAPRIGWTNLPMGISAGGLAGELGVELLGWSPPLLDDEGSDGRGTPRSEQGLGRRRAEDGRR
jgi:hypothetical protein